jgi:hypothetical protein
MHKKTKDINFIMLLMAVLALFLGVFLVLQQTNYLQKAGSSLEVTEIKNSQDLESVSKGLEEVDIESFDRDINSNVMDSSSF